MDIDATKKKLLGKLGEDVERPKAKKEHIYMPMFLDRLYEYDDAVFNNKLVDGPLQFVTVVGAVVVPILLSNSFVPKWLPFTISIIVAISAALTNHFKYGERARINAMTAEAMRGELQAFELRRKLYKDLDIEDAFELFMDRVDDILREHSQLSIHTESNKKEKQN